MDTSLDTISIEGQITNSLKLHEPRIKVNNVLVKVDGENNDMSAQITYDIIGLMFPQQIVDVLLLPARV